MEEERKDGMHENTRQYRKGGRLVRDLSNRVIQATTQNEALHEEIKQHLEAKKFFTQHIDEAGVKIEKIQKTLASLQSVAQTAEEKIVEAEKTATAAEARVVATEGRITAAETRAYEAERKVSVAETRANEAETKATTAEDKASAAGRKAEAAEDRAIAAEKKVVNVEQAEGFITELTKDKEILTKERDEARRDAANSVEKYRNRTTKFLHLVWKAHNNTIDLSRFTKDVQEGIMVGIHKAEEDYQKKKAAAAGSSTAPQPATPH